MIEIQDIEREAQRSLDRILPRVEEVLKPKIKKDRLGWKQFSSRLHRNFPTLFTLYADVYSDRYDFFFYLEDLIVSIARLWFRLKFNGIEEEHADIMKKSSKSLSALVVTRRER